MLKIFHVPGTRSVRPIWLCFELDLRVEVELIDFSADFRDSQEWRQISPAGKVPAMIDGDLQMFESGAMIQYLLERYGEGRLQPQSATPERALYYQWCWFAEATLIRPLGLYRVLRARNEPIDALIAEAETKFRGCLNAVEQALIGRDYLLGEHFTAADIMMGYSIVLIERLLDQRYPNLRGYLTRLQSRDAYQRVAGLSKS